MSAVLNGVMNGGLASGRASAAQNSVLGTTQQQFLTFALKGASYAVAIDSIKEILEFGTLTTVPMMPPFVRGVMNLRGAVIPVIDLAIRFGETRTETARRTCIVIFEVHSQHEGAQEAQTLGVIVDAVHEVLEIAAADIEPPPALGTHIAPEFIRGMAKVHGRLLITLDLERVLSINELAMLAVTRQQ